MEAVSLAQEAPFQLGAALVEPALLTVTAGGRVVRLEPRVMRVLVALHAAGGSVVSRDDLIAECWDGRIVTDDSIQRCIAVLRRTAAGVDPPPFSIETIPKVGYRLIVDEDPQGRRDPAPPPVRTPLAHGGLNLALLALFVVAAAATAAAFGRSQGVPNLVEVAPFQVIGEPGPDRSLAAALTDALASDLVGYGVPASVGRDRQPSWISNAPAYRIVGAISSDEDTVRAAVRIMDGRTRATVWSHTLDAPVERPDQLRAEVANEVGAAFTGPVKLFSRDRVRTDHLAAKLRIVRDLNEEPVNALVEAERLVKAAPDDPAALALFARSVSTSLTDLPQSQRADFWRRGREAAARAVALDPDFGEAIAAQGLLISPYSYERRLAHFRRGIRRAPDSAAVQSGFAASLGAVGQLDEAAQWTRRASASDPLSRGYAQGRILAEAELEGPAGAYARLEQVRSQWRDEPAWDYLELYLAARFLNRPSLDRARLRLGETLANNPVLARRLELLSAAMADRSPAAVKAFADDCLNPATARAASSLCAYALAALGRSDESFRSLEFFLADALADARPGPNPTLQGSLPSSKSVVLYRSPFAQMRRDPRMWRLFDRLGLVDFWRTSREWPDFCADPRVPVDCPALASAAIAER